MIQALNNALEDYKAAMAHHHRLCSAYRVAADDEQDALDAQIAEALDRWTDAEQRYIQHLEAALRAQQPCAYAH